MKKLYFAFTLVFASYICLGQSLRINDPQTWRGGQGTIEETKITFEPQGLFMKVDWEITFTAKGLNQFSEKDTVEVVYNFVLPEGAVVIDSWLWFEDSIIEALIIDRWSASQVYENIVGRRKDPSILTKNWGNNFELRIFPMAAKESRKVKITFLSPANWSANSVHTPFLSDNLLTTKYPIEKIDVFSRLSNEWKNPGILGLVNLNLKPENDEETGTNHHIKLDHKQLDRQQKFVVDAPLKNGYYLNFFENGDEMFYQLALSAADGLNIQKPQKILFLIDYQKENSELTQEELLQLLSFQITELLSEKDSFNLFFHDFDLQKASESWIPGDSASISQTISSLGKDPFVSYGNLPTLLAHGIDYSKNNPDCKIILLANSDKLNDIESANRLISDLIKRMGKVIPIFVGDFQTRNYNQRWINNVYYRGNEYFYRNVAKLTGGDYSHSFDGELFTELFRKIYQLASSESGIMDIHTTLENGFCYGRYILSDQSAGILNGIHLQTGKYSGDFPFKVEVSGIYDGEIFSKNLSISKENMYESDSVMASFWYGKEIIKMESANNSYSLIKDIIDLSMNQRVLSNYTAFLCLEPSMMGELDNIDQTNDIKRGWEGGFDDAGGMPVKTEKVKSSEFELSVYPNPFTERVTIEIQLPDGIPFKDVQFEIFDLFGKRIKVFNVEELNGDSNIKIQWDAIDTSGNRVTKGTYLFICTSPEGRISKKVIVM